MGGAYTLCAATHPYVTKESAVTLVLDTLAATTLAAVFSEGQGFRHTVETAIKSTSAFPVETLRDLYRFAIKTGNDKALFVVTKAAALRTEREEAHTLALQADGTVACDGGCQAGVRLLSGCIENGRLKGSTGKCYRCGGKGRMTPADVKRNAYYDNHVRRVYA